jgi:hypothetical protein
LLAVLLPTAVLYPFIGILYGSDYQIPNGEHLLYHDVQRVCKDVTKDMLQSLCSYVGITRHKEDICNLLGKGYQQVWTNLMGITQLVVGKVISCSTKFDGGSLQDVFTVVYQDWSESCLSSVDPESPTVIQEIPFHAVLGCVLSYERDIVKCSHAKIDKDIPLLSTCTGSPFHCWRTPE